jgi:hypothetical protein
MKEAFIFEDFHSYMIRKIKARCMKGFIDEFDLGYILDNCSVEERESLLKIYTENKCSCKI